MELEQEIGNLKKDIQTKNQEKIGMRRIKKILSVQFSSEMKITRLKMIKKVKKSKQKGMIMK